MLDIANYMDTINDTDASLISSTYSEERFIKFSQLTIEKDNLKISGIMLVVQGILWLMIAIDRWGAMHMITRAAYIIVIVLSVTSGIKELYKKK